MPDLVGLVSYGTFFLVFATVFAIIVLGLNLQWGFTGLFNVGVAGFVAIGAYTFAAPESFDVNGDWRGVSFAGDYDEPFEFTVVNGAVVSMTCSTSGLVRLSPPAPITHGEYLFRGEDGVAISGRILAPTEANGVVNMGPVGNVRPCVGAGWHATKQ